MPRSNLIHSRTAAAVVDTRTESELDFFVVGNASDGVLGSLVRAARESVIRCIPRGRSRERTAGARGLSYQDTYRGNPVRCRIQSQNTARKGLLR